MDRPSLCRNVLFFAAVDDGGDGPPLSSARPAIVTHVYQPETGVGLVDLVVFGRASFEFRSCVPHALAADRGACGWTFPPHVPQPLAADSAERG